MSIVDGLVHTQRVFVESEGNEKREEHLMELEDPALFVGELNVMVTLLPSSENTPLFRMGGFGSTSVFFTFKTAPPLFPLPLPLPLALLPEEDSNTTS